MSDTSYELFMQYGTDAERVAFTPDPNPSIQPLYGWYATDTGITWIYDTSWHQITGGGGGVLPATVQGDMLYASAANTIAALAKDANATRYLSNQGSSNNPSWNQVNLANGVTGDLPFANLTQGSALSVLGVTGNATADNASIAAGTDHQVLRRSGTAVAFGQVNLAQSAAVTGTLPIGNGGTGVSANFGAFLTSEVTLTDAQVRALPTTGVQVIPAAGAGFSLVLVHSLLYAKFAAGAYTNISDPSYVYLEDIGSGADISTYVADDSTPTPALTYFTLLFGTAGDRTAMLRRWEDTTDYALGWGVLPSVVNAYNNSGIRIKATNAAGDYTGGNAANTLLVKSFYWVLTL